MSQKIGVILLLAIFAGGLLSAAAETKGNVLSYSLKNIDGQKTPLSHYKGQVLLLVNTASRCGLTPQYKGLEALYRRFKDQGLVVLGFPANNFRGQEPGTNREIMEFCSLNYGVTFPMFAKISVAGADIDPLYQFLVEKETNPLFAGPIAWNFTKFLVDRRGDVSARFEPRQVPDAPEVIAAVEKALQQK